MKPIKAVECPESWGDFAARCWKHVAKSAKATSDGRWANVRLSHDRISSWWRS